jgi:beta-glucanase (GH16 family)
MLQKQFITILLLSAPLLSFSQNIPVEGYELFWSDEFDQGKLDETKWMHRYPGPRRNAVNIQSAVSVHEAGHLIITTDRIGGRYYTGMISTEGKFMTTFGYFEAKVYLQKQPGHWSAFWLQSPTKGREVGNVRDSGAEIDIFEYLGNKRKRVQHAVHWDGYKKEHLKSKNHKLKNRNLKNGWHTFGLLWTPDEYIFYVNGEETWRTSEGVSHRSQYIILSLEVEGWAGKIKRADLPDSFLVDYVRVYKPGKESQSIP